MSSLKLSNFSHQSNRIKLFKENERRWETFNCNKEKKRSLFAIKKLKIPVTKWTTNDNIDICHIHKRSTPFLKFWVCYVYEYEMNCSGVHLAVTRVGCTSTFYLFSLYYTIDKTWNSCCSDGSWFPCFEKKKILLISFNIVFVNRFIFFES